MAGGGGATGGDSGPELIRGISERVGVPRSMLGWGIKPEHMEIDVDLEENLPIQ